MFVVTRSCYISMVEQNLNQWDNMLHMYVFSHWLRPCSDKNRPNPLCTISQRKLWNQPLHTLDTRDTSLYFWLNYNWLLLFLCPSIFLSFEYSWASCLLSPQFSLAHLCWRKQLPPGRSTSRNWLPIGGGHLFWCFPTVDQHLVK